MENKNDNIDMVDLDLDDTSINNYSKKTEKLIDAVITPVYNGYTVTSRSTGKEVFVFETIDKAIDFIRISLRPTGEQENFLNHI